MLLLRVFCRTIRGDYPRGETPISALTLACKEEINKKRQEERKNQLISLKTKSDLPLRSWTRRPVCHHRNGHRPEEGTRLALAVVTSRQGSGDCTRTMGWRHKLRWNLFAVRPLFRGSPRNVYCSKNIANHTIYLFICLFVYSFFLLLFSWTASYFKRLHSRTAKASHIFDSVFIFIIVYCSDICSLLFFLLFDNSAKVKGGKINLFLLFPPRLRPLFISQNS